MTKAMAPSNDGQVIRRVLVANRGEIAVRVQRACRELGLEVVQVYSEADRDSLAVQMADYAVCIGPARASKSYLLGERVVEAAKALRADAIHPGYGFLSENAAFARLCESEGVRFIGPPGDVIALMGDKASARAMAVAAGVPVTPGSSGTVSSPAEAKAIAADLGYPVILKAVAGGGGRGMRVVEREADLAASFESASREATAAFGDGTMYVEKYLVNIRHVEIQILSDGDNVLHLGERDCSSQRRNQKLVEESPSPALSTALRDAMGEAAVRLCRHVGYRSAGTIECIVDPAAQRFYFMEMNTRVQVEHPVTECVTGIDVVKEQIRIAQGEPLVIRQSQVQLSGHAIECRINAEDPARNFMPSPGRVDAFRVPGGPGVRVDSHVFSGYVIPPDYDSLIAKLICWGRDREEALARMRRALTELRVDGVHTTAPFLLRLIDSAAFRQGAVHTRFVESFIQETSS
ncbi:acetyl-CoA carboxylase biotin carboxylase subunit [Variovorax sp. RA8]|uniref:acetyl-CoA carboxylase biotin carboxylase subunit n=1 Tax=Variovorax sp. (strain JCM 16519 / RA8) TaxID=662548 RepID=UPI001318B77C|nr:acetyl-CoA carboxylase biotin carboxylase subunit [Variovorax sp. RA8]VTU27459.1 Biotin carboxylase [Variovorax sp. RA8]